MLILPLYIPGKKNNVSNNIVVSSLRSSELQVQIIISIMFVNWTQENKQGYWQSIFSSVQSLSHVSDSLQPHESQHAKASLSITNSQSSPKLTSIKSVMPSCHLILCHPLLLLPPIPPSIRVFSNESTLRMRWPKYWNFSFSIIPSKEISGLISFRIVPSVEQS